MSWIAKPIAALSEPERGRWSAILAGLDAAGADAPLAQTFGWARATEALGARSYLVFDPDEGVGGILFSPDGSRFECVNGPLLDWDDYAKAPRQLATFAMGASKLDRSFRSLTLRPRWERAMASKRLANLPIEPFSSSGAATVQLAIRENADAQRQSLSPRLLRTLQATEREGVKGELSREIEPRLFAENMRRFGEKNEFTVPPDEWFAALVGSADLDFTLARATAGEGSRAELLVCRLHSRSYYLFGYEQRPEGLRSAISPSTAAHWAVLEGAVADRLKVYDLNGYVENAADDHPYAGVSRFKDQFNGTVVAYESPEFRIE